MMNRHTCQRMTGMASAMPPYPEKILPNDDVADIHAYLTSLPKPPDYKTIPLLNP